MDFHKNSRTTFFLPSSENPNKKDGKFIHLWLKYNFSGLEMTFFQVSGSSTVSFHGKTHIFWFIFKEIEAIEKR